MRQSWKTQNSPKERGFYFPIRPDFPVIVGGLIFAPEIFWEDFVKATSGTQLRRMLENWRCRYSEVNTIVYILTMIAAVIVFQALFRKWQLPVDDRMVGLNRMGCFGSSIQSNGRCRLFQRGCRCLIHLLDSHTLGCLADYLSIHRSYR